MVRVTITQLDASSPQKLKQQMDDLQEYLHEEPSDILLLPEMPFSDWFPSIETYDEDIWFDAKQAHIHWIDRLETLGVPTIIGTRPRTDKNGIHHNTSWIWHNGEWKDIHDKFYLPNEEGFWEENWYSQGNGDLALATIGDLRIGILICTEMWFMDQAREYSKEGIHLLFIPRSTPVATLSKWMAGGRTASVISGAFSFSSNHHGFARDGVTELGGVGWATNPEGELLEQTSLEFPWITVVIDEIEAEDAKSTYPRYVKD